MSGLRNDKPRSAARQTRRMRSLCDRDSDKMGKGAQKEKAPAKLIARAFLYIRKFSIGLNLRCDSVTSSEYKLTYTRTISSVL